jgi:hypothetical protein
MNIKQLLEKYLGEEPNESGLQHPGNTGINMLHGDHDHKPIYGKKDRYWHCPKCDSANTLSKAPVSGTTENVTCRKCGTKTKVTNI